MDTIRPLTPTGTDSMDTVSTPLLRSEPHQNHHRLTPSSYTCSHLVEVIPPHLSWGNVDYFPFKDACGRRNSTFSIRLESVPCCDEALTCSRSIVFDLQVNAYNWPRVYSFSFWASFDLLLWFFYSQHPSNFQLKGRCHTDAERHEGDQTPPRWLDLGKRFALYSPLCRTLHHSLSTQQRHNADLGQTHSHRCGATAPVEGERCTGHSTTLLLIFEICFWFSLQVSEFTIIFKIINVSFISQLLFQNQVCGLCGNFDGSEINDLQLSDLACKSLKRSTYIHQFYESTNADEKMFPVISSPMKFGNSWKATTPPCSDVTTEIFPCERNSYCSVWAQRRCMILKGDTFKHCHLLVGTRHNDDLQPYTFVTGFY